MNWFGFFLIEFEFDIKVLFFLALCVFRDGEVVVFVMDELGIWILSCSCCC